MARKTKLTTCEQAILKTLNYSAIFKYPLSFYQLCYFLNSTKTYDLKTMQEALASLQTAGKVTKRESKFYISKTRNVNWKARYDHSLRLLAKCQSVAEILKSLPWLKMLAVTGSAAAGNAEKTADIDIFVISAKDRVWLTRGFTALILKLLNMYSKNGEAGKICPNLFVDEKSLAWPKEKQNLYVARDCVTMLPLVDRDNTYFKFMDKNPWIADHFAHFKSDYKPPRKADRNTVSPAVDLLETLAMKLQLFYMRKKRTTEITQKHVIHFLKKDSSQDILRRFSQVK